jgi:hypothetical protein
VVFCFQNWCPGCHSRGFPDLKKMVDALSEKTTVIFLAIQTVFEGYEENTFKKMLETQKQYDLKILFGHDAANNGKSPSNVMTSFKNVGTPWFLLIDKQNNIIHSDFYLNVAGAIEFLKTL